MSMRAEREGDGRALGHAHRDPQLAPRVLRFVQDDLGVGARELHLDAGHGHDPPHLRRQVEHLERGGRQAGHAGLVGRRRLVVVAAGGPCVEVGHRWARKCTDSAMPMAEKKATVADPP